MTIPRLAAASLVFLRAEIPRDHPSAAVLGEERMGSGVAVSPDRVLTAHCLVLGASRVEVTALDGRVNPTAGFAVDHESGLALLTVERSDLVPARISTAGARRGQPVFLLTCTGE